jgi:PPE-repeat protein
MNFLTLPPEINSARVYLGAGPGSMLEAAAAGR